MKTKKFIKSSPHLPVKNLEETIKYYRDILGFYDEWTWTNKDGKATDGGIRRDDMRLLFAEDAAFIDTINSYKKSRFPLLWFVDNIDEVYLEFKSRNIELAETLQPRSYGLREFAFVDINGYYIRVAGE